VLELYKQGATDTAIETLENDELLCSQPQEKSASYFTFPNENECLDFEKSGFKFIDEQEYIEFIQQHYL
jgi:hypothetical protein